MMYIIGSKKQRREFEDTHIIPYFGIEEQQDAECVCMWNQPDDGNATLIVNLNGETPQYTVQVTDKEFGYIESETDYGSYAEAVEAYYRAR